VCVCVCVTAATDLVVVQLASDDSEGVVGGVLVDVDLGESL